MNTIFKLENVSLQFPGTNRPALYNINYTIKPGDFVILLGSNGSGKSSLLKLLHREYQPSSGEIYFQQKKIAQFSAKAFSRQIAVLSQDWQASLFPSLTVAENFLLMMRFSKQSMSHLTLANYLQQFNPSLTQKLNLPCDRLSGGEKQALALALYLIDPPSVLLLDEHTSALDPKTGQSIMQLTQTMLSKYHITCILTTHDLDIALNYGNRLLILNQGEIHQVYNKDDAVEVACNPLSKEKLIAHYF